MFKLLQRVQCIREQPDADSLGSLDNIGVAPLKDAIATVSNAAVSPPKHNLPCASAQQFSVSGSLAFSPITLHIFCLMSAIFSSIDADFVGSCPLLRSPAGRVS